MRNRVDPRCKIFSLVISEGILIRCFICSTALYKIHYMSILLVGQALTNFKGKKQLFCMGRNALAFICVEWGGVEIVDLKNCLSFVVE